MTQILKKNEMVYKRLEKGQSGPGTVIAAGECDGFKFYIKNINGMHPTAYVVVPKGHPLYGWEPKWSEEEKIDVHGGVTFTATNLAGADIDKDMWVIGWDYGHARDYAGYWDGDNREFVKELHKWTTDEIIAECERVCNKLKEMESK